jgi:hypothetical protein
MNVQPYRPRPIDFLRTITHGDWRIKLYTISYDDDADAARTYEAEFGAGLARALATLPPVAVAPGRCGAGFCILHRGRGVDYAVIAWWDRENELPVRVFVRPHADTAWRPARDQESFCVWDLEVIAFERDAYVETVLAEPPAATDAYLSRVLRTAPGRSGAAVRGAGL